MVAPLLRALCASVVFLFGTRHHSAGGTRKTRFSFIAQSHAAGSVTTPRGLVFSQCFKRVFQTRVSIDPVKQSLKAIA